MKDRRLARRRYQGHVFSLERLVEVSFLYNLYKSTPALSCILHLGRVMTGIIAVSRNALSAINPRTYGYEAVAYIPIVELMKPAE